MKDFPLHFYHKRRTVGEGSFGTVYEFAMKPSYMSISSSNKDLPRKIAVKRIQRANHRFKDSCREAQILMQPSHQNIVNFFGSVCIGITCNLVMELCQGTWCDLINADRKLDLGEVSLLVRQTLQGLLHLHENNIIHRDVKPANILLRHPHTTLDWESVAISQLKVKLADFGSSDYFSEEPLAKMSLKGTPAYMAPEIKAAIHNNKLETIYSNTVDLYSAGLSALALCTKKLEDASEYSTEALSIQTGLAGNSIFIDFLAKQLKKDPTERSSAAELLEQSFLAEDYQTSAESRWRYMGGTNSWPALNDHSSKETGYCTLLSQASTETNQRPNFEGSNQRFNNDPGLKSGTRMQRPEFATGLAAKWPPAPRDAAFPPKRYQGYETGLCRMLQRLRPAVATENQRDLLV